MISESVLYGKGVFTTIGVIGARTFLWEKHWNRLQKNAETIGIDISSLHKEDVFEEITKSIETNSVVEGRLRVTVLDESFSRIWSHQNYHQTRFFIIVGERRPSVSCFCLTVSPYSTNSMSPLTGVKSCNYLEPILSLDEAKARGFHEAIRLNERGFVTSACMANVFWLAGGELFTPGLSTGCLAGTTREFVMGNVDCREVEVGIEALADAEAIFLTSAGIGVQRVAEFEGKRLEMVDHPILHLLPY